MMRVVFSFVAAATCVLVACSDNGGPNGSNCPDIPSSNDCQPVKADTRPYFVTPLEIHTGSDGRDLYQAVLVANFGDFTATSDDTDVACVGRWGCLAPNDSDIVAVITAQSPGQTLITINSGSVSETVTVNVASYTPAQYDLGDERYNNPANGNDTDRQACASCHTGQGGAPHSPLSLGGLSDEFLLAAIQNSKYPDTCENDAGTCDCTPSGTDCSACTEQDCLFNEGYTLTLAAFGGGPGEHTYNLTADEQPAIMAYMRAIKPDGI